VKPFSTVLGSIGLEVVSIKWWFTYYSVLLLLKQSTIPVLQIVGLLPQSINERKVQSIVQTVLIGSNQKHSTIRNDYHKWVFHHLKSNTRTHFCINQNCFHVSFVLFVLAKGSNTPDFNNNPFRQNHRQGGKND
jgi:hypothetical protein